MSKKVFAVAAGIAYRNKLSVLFGGVDEFVNLGVNFAFERTNSFSLVGWFKTTGAGGSLVSKRGPSTQFQGWEINNSSGSLRFNLTNNNATNNRLQVKTTDATFNDGVWHHFAATYAGTSLASGMKIYIDGSSEALTTDFNTLSATILNGTSANLGARNSSDNPFIGNLDECAIYDKELSAAEVTQIYNGGETLDLLPLKSAANLVGWWRMGDGDTFPTLLDQTTTGADGTMTNMEVSDIVADVV